MGDTIWDWSTTAADNATADTSINWSEGQMPSTVNNSAREMMAKIAHFRNDLSGTLVTGGTGNAYTVSPGKPPTDLTGGWAGVILFDRANSGSATLQVGSLTAYPLVDAAGNDLAPGEITANSVYLVNFSTTTSKFHLTAAVHSSGVHTVSTISDLVALGGVDRTVYVLGYHSENDGGGGLFYWDAAEDKANHNGGTIIDPDVTFPTDWTDDVQRAAWFTAGTGTGCWIRVNDPVTHISTKIFGAKADGTTDDTDSIKAAISYAGSLPRTNVLFPRGEYRTTSSISVSYSSVKLIGESCEFETQITADFVGTDQTDYPAIIIKGRRCGVENLVIDASATRAAAAYSEYGSGIWIEPPDTASNNTWFGRYENCIIRNQPGDGITGVSDMWLSSFRQLQIHDNQGHGIRLDNGELTARTNKNNPGELIIAQNMIYDNGGHGIMIGNDNSASNRGFRIQLFNNDLYRNAASAGPRKSGDQMWAFMDTSVVESCAFDGTDLTGTTPTTRGAKIAGKATTVRNCRFLDVTPSCIYVDDLTALSYQTEGIKIEDIYVFGSANLDQAVQIASTAKDVQVHPGSTKWINGAVPVITTNHLAKRTIVGRVTATQTVNNSTTQTAISDLSFDMTETEIVQFEYNILYRGDATADIKFTLTTPSGATIWFAPEGSKSIDTVDTIYVKEVLFSTANSIVCGCDSGGNTRLLTIKGEVKTTGTAGQVDINFAQNTAVAADTDVLAGSYVIVTRH